MTTDKQDAVTDLQEVREKRQAVNVRDTRDIREALIGQMLEDIDRVVSQLEAVSANIGTTYDGAIDRLNEHEKKVAKLITAEADKSTRSLISALREDYAESRRAAGTIATRAEKAALLIDRAAWRLLVMSLVGGVVGGLLSVIGYIVVVNFVL